VNIKRHLGDEQASSEQHRSIWPQHSKRPPKQLLDLKLTTKSDHNTPGFRYPAEESDADGAEVEGIR